MNTSFILGLANETLSDVAQLLLHSPQSFTSFLLACKRFGELAERERYESITVAGIPGRRLLVMFLSGSPTSLNYRSLVKRLRFKGYSDDDMYLNASLLTEVIPLLDNLTTLWLEANSSDSQHLTARFRRNGMIRERQHPAKFISPLKPNQVAASVLTTPILRYIRLSSETDLISIAAHRPVKELDIDHTLTREEFANFLEHIENTLTANSVRILSIRLSQGTDTQLALALISGTFPNLRCLAVEQTGIEMKNVMALLAIKNPILPKLRYLLINRRFSYRTVRWGTSHPYVGVSQEFMEEMLKSVATNHAYLCTIGVGRTMFKLGEGGKFYRETISWNHPTGNSIWESIFGVQFRHLTNLYGEGDRDDDDSP